MKQMVTSWRHVLSLLFLLALALAARIRITLLDFNSLLTSYLTDDAFYYFKIAANIFSMHRITYDGEQLSNGFHPLWLLLIAPLYTPANAGIDFVMRVQWLMLLLQLLTVVALYMTLVRLRAGWWCAFVVTAVFCVHSTFIDMQMNGLETSLNSLMLLLLFNAYLSVFLDNNASLWRYGFFGLMTGLAFLTRTDNAICVLLIVAAILWKTKNNYLTVWPRLFFSGVIAIGIAAPWLIWNQMNFGSLIQGSGKVETILWGEPHFSWQATAYAALLTPMRMYSQLQDFAKLFISPYVGYELASLSFIVLWIISVFIVIFRKNTDKKIVAMVTFSSAVIFVFCYHAGIRSFVRIWYFVPVGMMYLLMISGIAMLASEKFNADKTINPVNSLLLVWLLSVVVLHSPLKLPSVAHERSAHFLVADWLNTNTSPTAVIGSMNSGILSYLTERKVVNLDGVVDQRSMQAHWKKRQAAYIQERGINYLVDNAGALNIFCSDNTFHRCETVFTFGDTRNPSQVAKIVNKDLL